MSAPLWQPAPSFATGHWALGQRITSARDLKPALRSLDLKCTYSLLQCRICPGTAVAATAFVRKMGTRKELQENHMDRVAKMPYYTLNISVRASFLVFCRPHLHLALENVCTTADASPLLQERDELPGKPAIHN